MAGDVRACHAYSDLLGLFLRLSRNFLFSASVLEFAIAAKTC
jgi:hypothetical protein